MKTKLDFKVFGVMALLSCLAFLGCSKKEETSAEEAPVAPEAAAPAAETPAAEASAPVPPVASQSDVEARMKQAESAMKKRDYETAARALITVQLSNVPMNQQQGFDHVNRMRELSRMITEGLASNDPNAQRAAKMLADLHNARMAR